MAYKHPFIYESIKDAFDDFKQKNGFHPAEMIADDLGFRGINKKQQLYNKLNLYTDKHLKIDDFIIILQNLLDSRTIPLRALVNHFGYELTPKNTSSDKCNLIQIILETNIALEVELGEFAKEVMDAIRDGEIDYDEAVSLRKRIREFRTTLDKLDNELQKITEL